MRSLGKAQVFGLGAFVALGITVSCSGEPATSTEHRVSDELAQVARSKSGMVVSAEPLATQVGAAVLGAGGNAADAAVATAFALAVVEPTMSGIGGRASILIRTSAGDFAGIDGLTMVPSQYRPDTAPDGYDLAAVPGVPAALAELAERFGSWPLERLLEPSVALAEGGFPLPRLEAERFAEAAGVLRSFPASRRYFLKEDGSTYRPGDLFVQEDLARTLRALARGGADEFYRGWIADSIHADMTAAGGFLTRAELEAYEARSAILVRGSYRGHAIVSNFRPASGHAVIQALQMMERFPVPGPAATTAWASLVGQATQIAIADRRQYFGSEEESAANFASREYADERSRAIELPGPISVRTPAASADPRSRAPPVALQEEEHTTHLTVVDNDGMIVTLTQSLGPSMGARLAASGLGFLYATRLGSVPGSRPSSTIAPTIVTDGADNLLAALGAAGDQRIISAIVQVLSRMIDHGMSLEDAVAAPRVHQLPERVLFLEEGEHARWPDSAPETLMELGFEVEFAPSSHFGRIHAVTWDPTSGALVGVAEPRGGGGAAGVR